MFLAQHYSSRPSAVAYAVACMRQWEKVTRISAMRLPFQKNLYCAARRHRCAARGVAADFDVGPGQMPRSADAQRQLFGYLYALVHNRNDTEDLYQQTSMVLWKKFDEYREGTSFFNWALTAARYEMLNFLRTRSRRRQFSAELRANLSDDFSALDTTLLQARLEALQDCKERLDEEDRCLLEACYGSERSFRETASHLGRSPRSVYKAPDAFGEC